MKFIVAAGLSVAVVLAQQVVHESPDEQDRYSFAWPIKRVAIIGAGVSGLLSYQALADANHFDHIRIFERDDVPGGNWHYSDEVPNTVPLAEQAVTDWWKSDYEPGAPPAVPHHVVYDIGRNKSAQEELERGRINHRQPKPVWKSLRANTPAPQQQVPGFPWPPHVEWATHHSGLQRYLRSFASWLGINSNDGHSGVVYSTRVESVEKRIENRVHRGWSLLLRKFSQTGERRYEEAYWKEDFDAVIVATGRFNVPYIPPIPGLAEWQDRFPDRILHSRQYRTTDGLRGKAVVVVGASASATGISSDINTVAAQSFLSVREHSDDPRAPVRRSIHLNSVPANTSIIGEIKAFHAPATGRDIREGRIELLNGTIFTGIDHLIFGTGFRYAFPFLSQYHNATVPTNVADFKEEQPIVTDGSHVRSLYLDTFYIDQPTIAFQGQNVGIQTFVYGKYVGTAIAKVWSGHAQLPSTVSMWRHFWHVVEARGGLKKGFQWLNAEENLRSLRHFVSWLNTAAVRNGGNLLETPPDVSQEMDLWMRARSMGPSTPNPDGRNDYWLQAEQMTSWNRAVLDDW